ncbi:MAG TPA: adenylate cyclase [Lachnospiraceae bacterium]|nr:adenylate cyclase [Lachnospiraceae bacterium]
MEKSYEIERKFLVSALPENLDSCSFHEIEQGYLCTDPVIRIRRQDDAYYLTCKSKGLMIREEYTFPLTETSYAHLKNKIDGHLIRKRRYLIPYGTYTIELDLFSSPDPGLTLAEVEFPSEEAALSFQAPDWFGEDVTHSSRYHNSRLSQKV